MPSAATPNVNRALGLLGEEPITDLTDDSKRAGLAQREYDALVDEMIQSHDWNFASTRKALLAQLADPPVWGGLLAYELPADCLRVRVTSLDASEDGDGTPWAVEGRTLVTTAEAVSIRYTARVDEGLWPPAFALAVVYELARRLAFGLTGKQSLAADGGILDERKCARRLALAKALDGQEGSPRRYITTALTRDRL